jgi:hypothetical protein
MEEEFTALIANNTWDLVPHPVGSNIVTDKWIFKDKFNSDSSMGASPHRHEGHSALCMGHPGLWHSTATLCLL